MDYNKRNFQKELRKFQKFISKESRFIRKTYPGLPKNFIIKSFVNEDEIIDDITSVNASFDEITFLIQINRKKGNERITELADLSLFFNRTTLFKSYNDSNNHIPIYTDEKNKSQTFLKYIDEFLAVYKSYTCINDICRSYDD